MPRVGIITGLAQEAEILTGYDPALAPVVVCAGADTARARALSRDLIARGCGGLISFGIAGGIRDGLGVGAVVIATGVIMPDGHEIATDESWRRRLLGELDGHVAVAVLTVAGSDALVATPEAKRALGDRTHAGACDMESHAVAEVAAAADVPFLAIRAVSDPIERGIPDWLPGTVKPDGKTNYVRAVAGLAAHPLVVPSLLGLRRDSAKALAALRRVAGLAGPGFGFA